jgi:hypothetical protein
MADELRIGLQELLREARMEHDADFLKEAVRLLSLCVRRSWRWRSKSTSEPLRTNEPTPRAPATATATGSVAGTPPAGGRPLWS